MPPVSAPRSGEWGRALLAPLIKEALEVRNFEKTGLSRGDQNSAPSQSQEKNNEARNHLYVAVRRLHRLQHYGSKRRRLRSGGVPGGLCRHPRPCGGRRTSCGAGRCRRAEEGGRYPPLKVYGPTAHVDNSRSI